MEATSMLTSWYTRHPLDLMQSRLTAADELVDRLRWPIV